MAYVSVKGGEQAILNSHDALAEVRRGDPEIPEIEIGQIAGQLRKAVDRVMAEGSLYDPDLAALALKQAEGDVTEAAFLLRAYRTTLEQFDVTAPIDVTRMRVERRVSAIFKDIPGGQILGPTVDYTHRMLDFSLMTASEPVHAPREADDPPGAAAPDATASEQTAPSDATPRATDILAAEGLLMTEASTEEDAAPVDLTREPVRYPAGRAIRHQALARGDDGWLLGLAYSTQRGYGGAHPYVGEIRVGEVSLVAAPSDLGFEIDFADATVTECEMINSFKGSEDAAPQFTRGYGLVFGHNERKAMSIALVDRALRAEEFGEAVKHPAQDEEFVLSHSDSLEASGFVQHLKLPHYVDFQADLQMMREMRAEFERRRAEAAETVARKDAAE